MSAIASEEQTNTTQAQRQKTTLQSRVRVSFKVALSECTVEGSELLRTLNLITGCGSKSCICGNWQELWHVRPSQYHHHVWLTCLLWRKVYIRYNRAKKNSAFVSLVHRIFSQRFFWSSQYFLANLRWVLETPLLSRLVLLLYFS